ncbi:hypothetical protein ACFV4P_20405 [Kitasatospora sp. NPDC059795]|uniref:hypothetical protein n=1 Tax=Kitasatospora sp. NPDC059795 TaxID=3346949 RepID=UPI00366A33D8
MRNPHEPYFRAVLAALGDLADPDDSFSQYANGDGEVMLTEIYVRIPGNDRHGPFGLVWTQVSGWRWGRLNDRGFLDHAAELVYGLIATPTTITTAVNTLLAGSRHLLPLADKAPEPTADKLTPELSHAVEQGDLDPETAAQLAFYA